MKEKVYVGIDLAKADSKVAVINSSGETLFKPFTITNSKKGVEKLLEKLSGYPKDQIVCGMEISSNYWENMLSYFSRKDVTCVLLNPYQVKKYRQAMGAKIKTDKVDAETIAQLLSSKRHEKLRISGDDAMELKELVRVKHAFGRRVKDLKKSVLSLLHLVFPEYTDLISHPFSKVSMDILTRFPTASTYGR